MVFETGALWNATSGDWNRQRTGSNDSSNFAYGEDLLEVSSGTLKYYFNGALVYTSTMSPVDLYPYITYYDSSGDVTINDDYTTTKRIDFTINDYGSSANNSGLGLNNNILQDGWQGLNGSFSFDEGKYWVYETLPVPERKTDKLTFTPSAGDVWSLAWEAAPETARIFTYV